MSRACLSRLVLCSCCAIFSVLQSITNMPKTFPSLRFDTLHLLCRVPLEMLHFVLVYKLVWHAWAITKMLVSSLFMTSWLPESHDDWEKYELFDRSFMIIGNCAFSLWFKSSTLVASDVDKFYAQDKIFEILGLLLTLSFWHWIKTPASPVSLSLAVIYIRGFMHC